MVGLPAEAKKLSLTCTDTSTQSKYEVSYDTLRKTLTTNHRDFTRPLVIEKTQDDNDGLLVWGTMPLGPASKNILVHFGRERWVTHFWGYDDKRRDPCV